MIRSSVIITLAAAICLTLTGCASLLTSSEPTPTVYMLHPVNVAPSTTMKASRNPRVVEVMPPGLPAGFDTEEISLLKDKGRTLDNYAAARWAAPLSAVLQDFTVQSLRRAFPKLAVDRHDLNIYSDYRLDTEVVAFQPVYTDADADTVPELQVNIAFTLIRTPDERVLTHFAIAKSAMAAENDLTSITSGLETLLRDVHAEAFTRLAPRLK